MSFANPTIHPPTLSSSRRRLHSRSPSRSPVRQNARDLDPLLRDLSPTTTLRIFTTEPTFPFNKHDSAFSSNFESASSSERALGAKAAQTCLELRSWTRELEGWEWPGSFDVLEPQARKRMRLSGVSTTRTSFTSPGEEQDEFWGSLPAQTVQAYEKRTDEIGQQLDAIDVEELKDFVLSAHQRAGSGRASINDSISFIGAATDLRRLDDFTALITATILQALPFLSRLHRLLDVWTMRLSVLRNTPAYSHDLKQMRTDLEDGWTAIAVSPTSGQGSSAASFTRERMIEMQTVMQQQVTSLGRRLDGFLDELEGREETVPEVWIEDFENVEAAYGDWVVQAERRVLENEWRLPREREARDGEGEEVAQENLEDGTRDDDALTPQSSRPISDGFDFGDDDLLYPPTISDGLLREDSETLADGAGPLIKTGQSSNEALIAPERAVDSPTRRARHVPIIIDYEGSNTDGGSSNPDLTGVSYRAVSAPLPGNDASEPATQQKPGNAVKKRAAFLDAHSSDRASSLQKQVKSPVRSFEHASNAFTRLFSKKGRSSPEQHSRTSSLQSRTSSQQQQSGTASRQQHSRTDSQQSVVSSKRGSANGVSNDDKPTPKKADEGVMWGGRRPVVIGRVSSTPGSPAVGPEFPDAAGRSRSASQRSLGSPSTRSKTPTRRPAAVSFWSSSDNRNAARQRDYADMPGGLRPPNRPAAVSFGSSSDSRNVARQRDYADMPGGFHQRSKSEDSRRARSLTPKTDFPDLPGIEGEVRRLRSMQLRAKVETYQPTRLPPSPLGVRQLNVREARDEYPADWPLASPPGTEAASPVRSPDVDAIESWMPKGKEREQRRDSSPEISSPRIPIETDVFDRMFVGGLEGTPEATPSPAFAGGPLATFGSSGKDEMRNSEPTLESTMLETDGEQESPNVDTAASGSPEKRRSRHGYAHVADHVSFASAGPSSPRTARVEAFNLHSAISGAAVDTWDQDTTPGSLSTDLSEGEVQDAQSVGYFPIQPSPEAVSRTSSSAAASTVSLRRTNMPPVSPAVLRLRIPDDQAATAAEASEDEEEHGRPVLLKRASLASIQSRPRSQVRSIIVRGSRRGSDASSAPQTPQTPRDSAPVSAIEPGSSKRTPSSGIGMVFFPSPPGLRSGSPGSPVSPLSNDHSPLKSRLSGLPRSAFADDDSAAHSPVSARSSESPAPLNAAMHKRYGRKAPGAAGTPVKKQTAPLKPGEDSFDRHVSEVLERLPSATIRFKARPGADTPSQQRTSEPRNYAGPRPKNGRVAPGRTGAPAGDMTLAPADPSPRKTATENEVKLYHLTQAGRDEPIKLFVRLVGENERVMVRVGGGWADLADYLRQYAEHHGSRTISGTGIELQTADGTAAGAATRKVSGSATEPKAKTPVTPDVAARPQSRAAADADWTDEAQDRFSMGDSTPVDDDSPTISHFPTHQQTPTNTIAAQRSTPKSTSTKASSRPSTSESLGRPGSRLGLADNLGRPSSRQGPRADAGLAGAAGGKLSDLPEEKAKWVEGMLEKAKVEVASAEKSKEEKAKYFGELGKAGGTRRVIFRGSSGAVAKAENARP